MTRKAGNESHEDIRPEHDAEAIRSSVRGKYAGRSRAGTNLALLTPDVVEAFPSDEAVNDALRLLMKVASAAMEKPRRRKPPGRGIGHDIWAGQPGPPR